MKSFQQPDFEVIKFEYEDIMRPSGQMGNEGNIYDQEDDYNNRGRFGTYE